MNFKQFVSTIDAPEGKAFEDILTNAATEGDWQRVKSLLLPLVDGFPDNSLRDAALETNYKNFGCQTWGDIQKAILKRSATHIVFQLDGNALYDLLNQESDADEIYDDLAGCPLGLVVGFSEPGTVNEPEKYGKALTAAAFGNDLRIPSQDDPMVAYIDGFEEILAAMRAAMFLDEDKYKSKENLAMYRICGWWMGLELNRYIADFCQKWAIDPTIPIFVSTRLGGGRLLGWHIPVGEQRLYRKAESSGPESSKQSSEPSPDFMSQRITHSIAYRIGWQGHEPDDVERAFISEVYCEGRDPQPKIDNWRANKEYARTPPEALSQKELEFMLSLIKRRQDDRTQYFAEKEEKRRKLELEFERERSRKAEQAAARERERARYERERRDSGIDEIEDVLKSFKMTNKKDVLTRIAGEYDLFFSVMKFMKRFD